jgi:hypothetical protein
MNISELKMRLLNKANSLIDVYFSNNGLTEKFINSTLKILLKQNLYKVDNILEMFADQNGDINVDEIINEYSKIIDDNGFTVDIKQYVQSDMIKSFMPNKILVIKRDDILNLFS